jgi:catechol 2,3-dioxygenase-like lactoylglutathione lyase family enzyme
VADRPVAGAAPRRRSPPYSERDNNMRDMGRCPSATAERRTPETQRDRRAHGTASLARPQAVPDSAPMGAPSPLRLDHVVVPVCDAEEARRFYRDTVGLTLVAAFAGDDWGGHRWLMMVYGLGTGGQHLVTVAFEGLGREVVEIYPRDARHCAFAVGSSEEWRRWQTRLSASGAAFWEETHGEQRSLYVVDPSHNVLEITTAETPPFAAPGEPPDAVVDRWIVATSRRG